MTPMQRCMPWIVGLLIVSSVGLNVYIFAVARQDAGLRTAALLGASNTAIALLAIASTLLTGKDLTDRHNQAQDLPAGSLVQESSMVQTPPITVAPVETK